MPQSYPLFHKKSLYLWYYCIFLNDIIGIMQEYAAHRSHVFMADKTADISDLFSCVSAILV